MYQLVRSLYLWIDAQGQVPNAENEDKIDLLRCMPFFIIHALSLGVFFVDFTWSCVWVLAFTYSLRVFSLTAFYHRYFSHRAFKTSRLVQFIFAFCGATAAQRGPLWWSAHHRFHHKHSDKKDDKHSPHVRGFFWSHIGWFLQNKNFRTDESFIKDWVKYPELKFINRYDALPPLFLVLVLYLLGGLKFVFWGYFLSTVLIYHVTFSINSLAHLFGKRTYATDDHSKNNWFLALLSFGEGWHNNHHHYPSAARQGRNWKQLDISYLILQVMEKFNLVWDLRQYPKEEPC